MVVNEMPSSIPVGCVSMGIGNLVKMNKPKGVCRESALNVIGDLPHTNTLKGSSAMPHKRNHIICKVFTGLQGGLMVHIIDAYGKD